MPVRRERIYLSEEDKRVKMRARPRSTGARGVRPSMFGFARPAGPDHGPKEDSTLLMLPELVALAGFGVEFVDAGLQFGCRLGSGSFGGGQRREDLLRVEERVAAWGGGVDSL